MLTGSKQEMCLNEVGAIGSGRDYGKVDIISLI